MENIEKLLEFFRIVTNLNNVFRYSEYPDLKNTQNTASHSWRLTLMTFTVAKELKLDIDVEKAIKIAIVHDIAESITGDIDHSKIYTNQISEDEKNRNEKNAIIQIKKNLSKELADEIEGLWLDYEYKRNEEAKFVSALDKIEALLYILEKSGKDINLPDMTATYADKAVTNYPKLKPLLKSIKSNLRILFEKNDTIWKKEYDLV